MARNDLYDSIETSASMDALEVLASNLPKPLILLGGWAVYLTVNESYQKEHGLSYLGSRDVDLGFHIPKNVTEFDLITGNFKPALIILKRLGYRKDGPSRFCRVINKKTGETIPNDIINKTPEEDRFHLFIDPIVDYNHPSISEMYDITPIEEPILTEAVLYDKFRTWKINDSEIRIPEPEILLEMKLSSLVKRTRNDKVVKDVCDIYSLIWHSREPFLDVVTPIKDYHQNKIDDARSIFTQRIKEEAIHYLGVELKSFEGVINNLFE